MPIFGGDMAGNLTNFAPVNTLTSNSGFMAIIGISNFLGSSSSPAFVFSTSCCCWMLSSITTKTLLLTADVGLAAATAGLGIEGFFWFNFPPASKPPAITSGFIASKGNSNFLSSSLAVAATGADAGRVSEALLTSMVDDKSCGVSSLPVVLLPGKTRMIFN
jgi:hypothetical protein